MRCCSWASIHSSHGDVSTQCLNFRITLVLLCAVCHFVLDPDRALGAHEAVEEGVIEFLLAVEHFGHDDQGPGMCFRGFDGLDDAPVKPVVCPLVGLAPDFVLFPPVEKELIFTHAVIFLSFII